VNGGAVVAGEVVDRWWWLAGRRFDTGEAPVLNREDLGSRAGRRRVAQRMNGGAIIAREIIGRWRRLAGRRIDASEATVLDREHLGLRTERRDITQRVQ
jgi:hypothetical protein